MAIRPGKFLAKVIDYGVRASRKDDPLATVRFQWTDNVDHATNAYNWTGSFNEGKAREITLTALATCSVMEVDPANPTVLVPKYTLTGLDALADGPASGLLDMTKEVQIDVQNEIGMDGKEYAKIAWINPVGGGKFQSAMNRDDVKVKMAGMNIKADLIRARQQHAVKFQASTAIAPEELPF